MLLSGGQHRGRQYILARGHLCASDSRRLGALANFTHSGRDKLAALGVLSSARPAQPHCLFSPAPPPPGATDRRRGATRTVGSPRLRRTHCPHHQMYCMSHSTVNASVVMRRVKTDSRRTCFAASSMVGNCDFTKLRPILGPTPGKASTTAALQPYMHISRSHAKSYELPSLPPDANGRAVCRV